MNKIISIVIVNYNSDYDTLKCLNSIEKASDFEGKIYLIDNSEIPSLENKLKSFRFQIEYLFQNDNIGFAKACNLGIGRSLKEKFEFTLLLNNDTELVNNNIIEACQILKSNPEFGVLGLVNYYSSIPDKIWQSGMKEKKYIPGFKKTPINQVNNITECDYVPGSSMLIKNQLFKTIDLFDENYFAYYEEVDFCKRVSNNKMKIGFLNNSIVLHKVGVSSSSYVKWYLKTRNKLYYNTKFQKSLTIRVINISFISSIDLFRAFLSSPKNFKYCILGIHHFIFKKFGKPQFI